ncbi:MAG: SAM-dependent DNA methyltransferase, partial [Armatimonadetes bacterium]|nr:SAM-dependent DNA methyltransferase [Armatimonadota bacterium]
VMLDGKPRVVEYAPDPDLRDSEQISFLECPDCHTPGYIPTRADADAALERFLRREVLPYAPDAWYDPDSLRIGYEINFNRYFYQPKPMRSLHAIRADLIAAEQEAEGLLAEILGGQP